MPMRLTVHPFPHMSACLPDCTKRTGQVVAQTGSEQEILPLPGIYFFDGWRVHPMLPIPGHLPRTKEAPVQNIALTAPAPGTEPARSPEEEARDILATAAKNQPDDGPNTRRAAVRACKYLRAMVNQYGSTIQEVHKAARAHTQMSKGTAGAPVDYRPQGGALPVISPELTSELVHCLSTLPDPSSATRVPDIETALQAVHRILPKLEARMIEFLAEWLVTLLIPATHVLEVRAPHLSFMLLKEYWFRELYLGLKVTASFDRSESYTRVIDGQVRCITPEIKPQNLQAYRLSGMFSLSLFLCRHGRSRLFTAVCAGKASRTPIPPVPSVSSQSTPPGLKTVRYPSGLKCEKRKPKYTACVLKSTLSLSYYARRKHLLCLRLRSYLLPHKVK